MFGAGIGFGQVGKVIFLVREGMGIGVEREARVPMTKLLRYPFHRASRLKAQRCERVP